GSEGWPMFYGTAVHHVTIRNLVICSHFSSMLCGNSTEVLEDAADNAIVIHASDVNASHIVVENCEIYGFKVRGIRTASNMQIQRLRVVNNYIHDIGNIDHPDTPSPLCFGTMLMNGGGCGFGIQPGAVHDGSIAGNIIEHVGTRDGNWGIYASDNSGLTIV